MKNYCPKCRYYFGSQPSGKCPDCAVALEDAPPSKETCSLRSPWRINRDPTDRPGVYDAEGNRVADCDSSALLTDEQKRRNAALIALAPETRAALQRLVAAYVPRPLGGIVDEHERAAADMAWSVERGEARSQARDVLSRHNDQGQEARS